MAQAPPRHRKADCARKAPRRHGSGGPQRTERGNRKRIECGLRPARHPRSQQVAEQRAQHEHQNRAHRNIDKGDRAHAQGARSKIGNIGMGKLERRRPQTVDAPNRESDRQHHESG